jgi:hypothetical protein
MRQRGTLAEGHDGFKSRADGPHAPHAVLNLRCEFEFADAGLDEGKHLFEGLAPQSRCCLHQDNFAAIFDRTKALY